MNASINGNFNNGNKVAKNILLSIVCFGIFFLPGTGCCPKKIIKNGKPRLVLMVVVDQLRADMVSRLENRFGKGGFRYLMEKGIWYKNARYDYATTITAVSHATIFTGATPAQHGIIGNNWYDRTTHQVIKAAEKSGNSSGSVLGPYQLTSTTIGDELVLAYNRCNRVFNVSFKDRSAILPGGKLGKAFWFGKDEENKDKSDFGTSDYYYEKNTKPLWLADWKKNNAVDGYKNKVWNLLYNKDTYIYGNNTGNFDDRLVAKMKKELPGKIPEKEYQTIITNIEKRGKFPHRLDNFTDKKGYYDALGVTPFMDDLTMKFACHVLENEKLGDDGVNTDMLTVSFSALDSVGHVYGPDSLEYEDHVLRLDRTLHDLFLFIDKKVGLEDTLIVLVGDHGTDSVPEYRDLLGISGGRIIPDLDFKAVINHALQEKYNIRSLQAKTKVAVTGNLYIGFWNPSIYLDEEGIESLHLNLAEVERVAAEAIMKRNSIAIAVTRSDLLQGKVIGTPWLDNLKIVCHPKRSGNILIMQEPHWYLYPDLSAAAMHGSPYNYDNHVPLFFAGPGIKHRDVYRLVCPRDIVVTVALKLGICAPPAASCVGLPEVLDKMH